ncbi:U6 snRNA-associated Sm-like protein LSm7 [Nematocida sp. AWRm80]|nr:U6 snRNA-associated Sm-like protein LSm7 [Nematocida sp. AWRm80]
MKEDRAQKREQVFDLERYINKTVIVSFLGGIQVRGVLKGYDQLLNMVIEKGKMIKVPDTESTDLNMLCNEPEGSIMCKGSSVCSIDLVDTTTTYDPSQLYDISKRTI